MTRLYGAGYLPAEQALNVVLPRQDEGGRGQEIACWVRRGRSYMDVSSWLRLRREAGARWRAFATAEALPPVGSMSLASGLSSRSAAPQSRGA